MTVSLAKNPFKSLGTLLQEHTCMTECDSNTCQTPVMGEACQPALLDLVRIDGIMESNIRPNWKASGWQQLHFSG